MKEASSVVFSSTQHNWRSPERVLRVVRSVGAGIVLDPCTDDDNPTGAARFYTPAIDGLAQSWHRDVGATATHGGLAYANPPYGDAAKDWVAKAIEESRAGLSVLLLMAARTDVPWYHDALEASSAVVWVKGRLRFEVADKPDASGAPFPSVLVMLEQRALLGALFVGACQYGGLGAGLVTRPCAVWPETIADPAARRRRGGGR